MAIMVARSMAPLSRTSLRPAVRAASAVHVTQTRSSHSHRFVTPVMQSSMDRRATLASAAATEEKFAYQAETDRLMDMIVNSLYSNKEVFLRELVSNASDALDKVRITSLTDPDVLKTGTDLEVRIKSDKESNTIVIEDTGIGMTKEDLLSSLGTIARSGTAKFAEAMKQAQEAKDSNLIGQFGVGFYSSFLVADRVTVQTKHNDDKQWAWESTAGSHEYSVREEPDGDLARGTRITLHVKEDCADLLEEMELSRLIKQYSEFISFPIQLWSKQRVPKQVEDEEATKKAQEFADKKAKDEGKEDTEKVEPVMKTEYDEVEEFKLQNENKPIWTRTPKDVTDEEYSSFFKQTFKEFMDPMARSHFNVEGTYEFSGLLYIPGMAPFDMMMQDQKKSSIRLFVKRVFISDQFDEQLLPKYLGFVKGVVDSADLPLNVSREILQESRVVRIIRKQLVKRCLDMMTDLMGKGEDEYEKFWSQFGRNIKLGIVDDPENKDKLASLLRYKSNKSGDVLTGLDDYVSRMKEGQKGIYYVSAESDALAANSPFVEALQGKDLEVLFYSEAIDEWTGAQLSEYKGHKLVDVTKEGLELDEEDKKKVEQGENLLKPVVDFIQQELGGKVSKASVSARLTDSPCILVTSQQGWSANMQRIMKSQPMGDNRAMDYMKGEKIMEINPDNQVIQALNDLVKADSSSPAAREIVNLMYDTALLTSGFDVDSPKDYASKVYDMMGMALMGEGDAAPAAKASTSKPVEADQVIEEK